MDTYVTVKLEFENVDDRFDAMTDEEFVNFIKDKTGAADAEVVDWETLIGPGDPEWDDL